MQTLPPRPGPSAPADTRPLFAKYVATLRPRLWHDRNGQIVLAALFVFFTSSGAFFSRLIAVYGSQPGGLLFSASVIGLFALLTVLFFLTCHGRLTR